MKNDLATWEERVRVIKKINDVLKESKLDDTDSKIALVIALANAMATGAPKDPVERDLYTMRHLIAVDAIIAETYNVTEQMETAKGAADIVARKLEEIQEAMRKGT